MGDIRGNKIYTLNMFQFLRIICLLAILGTEVCIVQSTTTVETTTTEPSTTTAQSTTTDPSTTTSAGSTSTITEASTTTAASTTTTAADTTTTTAGTTTTTEGTTTTTAGTTTTAAPTTTTVADGVIPAIAFTNMRSYYNARYKVHGYCGTDACRTRLWGEGFSRTENAGIVGKIVYASSASLADAQKACPNGGQFLMLVGMIAEGRGFMHTFYGGMPQGYVPTRPVCGATLPVRAYSPVVGDDIVYTTGSPPSGYRVRHDGRILFYLWPQ